jgi:hypothetical protein
MPGILDRVAKSYAPISKRQQYCPATPEHFFVLRLAQRLTDAAAIHHYVELCDRHSDAVLLSAYRAALKTETTDLARAFHAALENRNGGGSLPAQDLAAVRIERRAIAVAIFHGTKLKYPPIAHQLSSDGNKALGSAALFISRVMHKCSFSSAALERLPNSCEAQRSQLSKIVTDVLLESQVSLHHYDKREVLSGFGQPPLRFRSQVREVIAAIWPDINGSFGGPLVKDALALGLYAQTERLFLE